MDQLNRDLAARTVRVRLFDGRTLDVAGIRFAPDSTSWVVPSSGTVEVVATSSIFDVSVSNRGRTVRRGGNMGALIGGLALGAATGAMAYDLGDFCFPSREECEPSRGGLAVMGFALGGAVGAAVGWVKGTLLGLLLGGRDEVRFEPLAREARES